MPHSARRFAQLTVATALSVCGCIDSFKSLPNDAAQGATAAEPPRATVPNPAVEGERRANRLSRETSPYLLMHAHNPVDWYPWGPEAFEKARQEGKMIFLSVGYSSCYWCHVMERLVFSDPRIASLMNERFVSIKVDREERPDLDEIYMTSLQAYYQLQGNAQAGGWPLSLFLTPEGKPFAGGTYFPPEDEGGRIGFPSVIERVTEIWGNQREQVEQQADAITRQVRLAMRPPFSLTPVTLDRKLVERAAVELIDSYDAEFGGVGFHPERPNAPKFPVPNKLAFLQYWTRRHGDQRAEQIIDHTLEMMARGGIYDHLGGGFHRYSTDRYWRVPHFEKMLYDNAQLAGVYVEAFRQSGRPQFRETAEGILTFVLRDMTDSSGGFYSALDAESDHIEGKYYAWTKPEVESILGTDTALFESVYGMNQPSTFEHGHVLWLPKSWAEAATEQQMSLMQLQQRTAEMRDRLLAVRRRRNPPLLDDKILAGWNGLMIKAFAEAGDVLDRPDYLEVAEKAALFVLSRMRDDQGRLLRSFRGEQAKLNAYLDDYAFMIEALLTLHFATEDDKWLNAAQRLTEDQIRMFGDNEGGGFFFTSHHHEQLIARTKSSYDSVLPAGNSVSVRNLIRLASLTGEARYREIAKRTIDVFSESLQRAPQGQTSMAWALSGFLDDPDYGSVRDSNGLDRRESVETPSTGASRFVDPVGGARRTSSPEARKPQDREPVTAKAYLPFDKLPAGGRCRFVVSLQIRSGWHINANPAGSELLIPTTVTIQSRAHTELKELTYPAARRLDIEGLEQPLLVYSQQAVIRGALETPADAAGSTEELQIRIRYQACNETKCLAPKTITLTVRIPVSEIGEEPRRINAESFPQEDESNQPIR